jgi:uncharacterized membrane protein YtjA (UPF0391 family)
MFRENWRFFEGLQAATWHGMCMRYIGKAINELRSRIMLYWALVFFIVAIVAGALGFFGLAAGAAEIAKILFFVFIVLFIISLLTGMRPRGTV